jgi:hypothetical protein
LAAAFAAMVLPPADEVSPTVRLALRTPPLLLLLGAAGMLAADRIGCPG